MIKLFLYFLAVVFPWASLFLNDNPGGGLIALIMQASIIGWPFASIWALRIEKEKWDTKNSGPKKQP